MTHICTLSQFLVLICFKLFKHRFKKVKLKVKVNKDEE